MILISPSSLAVIISLLVVAAKAHRSLPSGITCGPQFSSPETALTIPNPEISWANYAIYTCEHPVNWLEAVVVAEQKMKFTVTVPVINRFVDVKMSTVFIGPGLPTLSEDSGIPNSVMQYATDNDMGGVIFKSPQNQSTCEHLTSQIMIDSTTVKDGRCHFYEPYSDSNLWVVMDNIISAPESGTYKIAVYEENGSTAKSSFACCDWPEDFVTPYPTPESTCPACGTSSSNTAWTSLFYEHKTMTEYGGFPPMQSCSTSMDTEYPSDDKCPSLKSIDDEQSESCNLGCNIEGECHSHNVFGGCTHLLDWDMTPKFGGAYVKNLIIFKDDKIRFKAPTTLPHNLVELVDETSLSQCNFDKSMSRADVGEIFTGHEITFDTAGTFYFSCGIGAHCNVGQKLIVEVKDALEGLKCHSHNTQGTESDTPIKCPDGLVKARSVDNDSYGSLNANECSEFCTSPIALNYMGDIAEEGSCVNLNFIYNPIPKIVKPPNSPMDIEVIVFSNSDESTQCHCHSYEEIACPEEENPDDLLYVEHIQEITSFCTGVLDGSEEDCPYKCFQPMEVLHLHYIECPSRMIDSVYKTIDATNKCHIGAPAPEEGSTRCKSNDSPSDESAASSKIESFLWGFIGLSSFFLG